MADDLAGAISQIGADIRPLRYDSGVRNVASLITTPADWTAATPTVVIQRVGSTVDVVVGSLGYTGTSTGRVPVFTLPTGFRPIGSLWARTFRDKASSISTAGVVSIDAPSGPVDYFTFTFTTRQAAPAMPPGSPG